MPTTRKKPARKPTPRKPARVRKKRPVRRAQAHRIQAHHRPELVGLGIAGLGVLLAAVLWVGLNGGPVAHVAKGAVGAAAYLVPLVFVPLGALIVTRSALVDVRPFRLGLVVAVVGLLLTLGTGHGGVLGDLLESLVATALGTTGATILGVLLTIAGCLFLTGASLGAILRRSGHVVRAAHTRVRRERTDPVLPEPVSEGLVAVPGTGTRPLPPVDVKNDYPDLVSETTNDVTAAPPPILFQQEPDTEESAAGETQETLFEPAAPVGDYTLPERTLLKKSKAGVGPSGEANQRVADALVTCPRTSASMRRSSARSQARA
jgi:hypothetical protein